METNKYYIVWADYNGCYIESFDNVTVFENKYTEIFNMTVNDTHIKAVIFGHAIKLIAMETVTKFVIQEF